MCREVNVPRDNLIKATREPFSLAYIDKIKKTMRKILMKTYSRSNGLLAPQTAGRAYSNASSLFHGGARGGLPLRKKNN